MSFQTGLVDHNELITSKCQFCMFHYCSTGSVLSAPVLQLLLVLSFGMFLSHLITAGIATVCICTRFDQYIRSLWGTTERRQWQCSLASFILVRVMVDLKPVLETQRTRQRYILNRMSVHCNPQHHVVTHLHTYSHLGETWRTHFTYQNVFGRQEKTGEP